MKGSPCSLLKLIFILIFYFIFFKSIQYTQTLSKKMDIEKLRNNDFEIQYTIYLNQSIFLARKCYNDHDFYDMEFDEASHKIIFTEHKEKCTFEAAVEFSKMRKDMLQQTYKFEIYNVKIYLNEDYMVDPLPKYYNGPKNHYFESRVECPIPAEIKHIQEFNRICGHFGGIVTLNMFNEDQSFKVSVKIEISVGSDYAQQIFKAFRAYLRKNGYVINNSLLSVITCLYEENTLTNQYDPLTRKQCEECLLK